MSGPPARGVADLTWLGAGRVLLLGGLGNATGTHPVLDDAWVFDTATSRWSAVAAPTNGGRYEGGAAHLATGVVLTYGGKGTMAGTFGSSLFRRYTAATDAWSASTTGVLVSPGILYGQGMAHLSPGRVFMLEGVSGTSGTMRSWAWIYDDGPSVSDLE